MLVAGIVAAAIVLVMTAGPGAPASASSNGAGAPGMVREASLNAGSGHHAVRAHRSSAAPLGELLTYDYGNTRRVTTRPTRRS